MTLDKIEIAVEEWPTVLPSLAGSMQVCGGSSSVGPVCFLQCQVTLRKGMRFSLVLHSVKVGINLTDKPLRISLNKQLEPPQHNLVAIVTK